MKVNNKPAVEVKIVDCEYVIKNEGIYKYKPSADTYLVNLGTDCVLYYSARVGVLEPLFHDNWRGCEFIPLPNATLIFDVKEQ